MTSVTMNYDPNLTSCGQMARQAVRLTFAMWEYRKTIDVEVGGNCTGFSVIETAVEHCYAKLPNAPAPYDDDEIPVLYLTSKDGEDTLECVDEEDEGGDWLKAMLISAEITDIRPDPNF